MQNRNTRTTLRTLAPKAPRSSPSRRSPPARTEPAPLWTFLTNHSHVLVCLLQDPSARLRDVAARIGITERAVQKIILDLEHAGVLEREKQGRRNHYNLSLDLPLRHAVEAHCTLRQLLAPIIASAKR